MFSTFSTKHTSLQSKNLYLINKHSEPVLFKVIGETLGRLHRIAALTSVCIWKKVNIVSATMCNVLTLA